MKFKTGKRRKASFRRYFYPYTHRHISIGAHKVVHLWQSTKTKD